MLNDSQYSVNSEQGKGVNVVFVKQHFVQHRCFYCTVICAVVVSLVLGLVCGLAVTLPLRKSLLKNVTLLDQSHVTQGDTYLVNASRCRSLELAINPGPFDFSGKLDALSYKPDLSHRNDLKASYDGTLGITDMFAKWIFHLHPGTTLGMSSCAVFTSNCQRATNSRYNFAIIESSKFTMWMQDKNSDYTVNYTQFMPGKSCVNDTTTTFFTYTEEGDYYHVFLNSASAECNLNISANATFMRTEYNNRKDTSCTVDRQNPMCHKFSPSDPYAFVEIDKIDGVDVNWTEQIDFTLTCGTHLTSEDLVLIGVLVSLAPLVITLFVIFIVCVPVMMWKKHKGYENLSDPYRHEVKVEDEGPHLPTM